MFFKSMAVAFSVSAISLLTCLDASSAEKKDVKNKNAFEKEIETKASIELKSSLKDPESLQISNQFFVVKTEGQLTSVAICGLMNAKNSYGGYVGRKMFFSHWLKSAGEKGFTHASTKIDDTTEEKLEWAAQYQSLTNFERIFWNKYCTDESHPPIIRQ